MKSSPCSYNAAHHRVRYTYGSASQYQCQMCDQPAKEWAYDHCDNAGEMSGETIPGLPIGGYSPNIMAVWSPDRRRYMALCGSYHQALDIAIAR